ncbi:MAG: cytochrome c-type biogenesis protein CcmH [Pseudomonadales bacterium]|jgi:cytochrome c-type biogenesis protein CcmH|nr:cytochrome c-type biogenesis protein CcmH [Pseudomonadales bacterium]MDP6471972.1 cytochrome c-type biogenesis protein CcmH [Pseudomonadales bacterium]MDP6826757.1 cytochrome c-type biogenesis protein CcmH [Pseudomonadales bacterium]MDP6971012.1 cytochrome c-type biogenesis protein CcmH [Pseudomonadales bacterium]|tara:strand:+ start:1037 stop:1501 length:465 start_codon:yes stop_codon:yes gene_type:complete
MRVRLYVLIAVLASLPPFLPGALAASQIDVYHFEDAGQERRYRGLIDEFRCPKCLNTNLSGSDAPIAKDLRATVHRLVVERGLSDDEVRAYLLERYGDFVLYDPPLHLGTVALWVGPTAFVLIGIVVLTMRVRRQQGVELSDDDRERLHRILGD